MFAEGTSTQTGFSWYGITGEGNILRIFVSYRSRSQHGRGPGVEWMWAGTYANNKVKWLVLPEQSLVHIGRPFFIEEERENVVKYLAAGVRRAVAGP